MKKNLLFILIIVSVSFISAFAQQKVKDHTLSGEVLPDKDALLELESANKGLLHARVQLIQSDDAAPLSQHRAGMMVYNTATVNDVVPGIYYNNGNRWILVAGGGVTPINYNPVTYELTYVDIKGDTHTINLEEVVKAVETVTVMGYDAVAHKLSYQDENGLAHAFDLNVGTLTFDDQTNALAYTSENGTITNIPLNNTSLTYDPLIGILRYVNTLGQLQELNLSDVVDQLETVTTLSYDSDTHVLAYVDENRVSHTFNLDVGRLTYDKAANTLLYTAEDGTVLTIPLNETDLTYDATSGILTYTNSLGIKQAVDLKAANIAYNNATSGLTATDVQAAIDELAADLGDIELRDNGDATFSLLAPDGTTVLGTVSKANLTDEGDGLFTFTNQDGTDVQFDVRTVHVEFNNATNAYDFHDNAGTVIASIDLNAANIAYNNATSGLTATDVQAAIDELAGNINSADASNGLHIETVDPDTEGHVKLGGPLTEETTIETDATNTLAITGLQRGNLDQDSLLMADANGVLKTISPNKFVRFFYMPSVVFDTSNPDPTGPMRTKNLYQEYVNQFTGAGTPGLVGSTGAPATIPYLPQAEDLYYYITYYDDDVFADLSIDENGVLSYRVIGPGTPTSFMNIVFVIKE